MSEEFGPDFISVTDEDGNELLGSHKMDLLSEEEYIDILDNKLDPSNA